MNTLLWALRPIIAQWFESLSRLLVILDLGVLETPCWVNCPCLAAAAAAAAAAASASAAAAAADACESNVTAR